MPNATKINEMHKALEKSCIAQMSAQQVEGMEAALRLAKALKSTLKASGIETDKINQDYVFQCTDFEVSEKNIGVEIRNSATYKQQLFNVFDEEGETVYSAESPDEIIKYIKRS